MTQRCAPQHGENKAPGARVLVAVVTGVRGLKGEVRLKSFTADPTRVDAYGPLSDESGRRRFSLRTVGAAKGGQVIARIDGVADRTAAEALKGVRLYVDRDALPEPEEDEYYLSDLVGLIVVDGAGENFGRVEAADDYGAGVVLDIVCEDGVRVVVPFTRAVIPEVDLAGRRMVIVPPGGLFDTPPNEDGGEGGDADG
ncbi:ribosome maturation factor RimM [Varunaivibrio sulfuroxidans]|nr:ribosome maturation factor RimM [Varunaivibrio sulfuroxidans]WES30237.1 ribosome maturation factor RimM [Varunaivibrio sulfuroxidans]